MPLIVLNGPVIEAGESLSDAVDASAGTLVRVTAPAAWDGMWITFQISTDGVFYNDYFNARGQELKMAILPGAAIGFDIDMAHPVAFVKFRSVTRDAPVIQKARREFAVAIDIPATP